MWLALLALWATLGAETPEGVCRTAEWNTLPEDCAGLNADLGASEVMRHWWYAYNATTRGSYSDTGCEVW